MENGPIAVDLYTMHICNVNIAQRLYSPRLRSKDGIVMSSIAGVQPQR
jgi:hypothetical protein